MRGLAIAGVVLLAILLVLAIGRRREGGLEGYDDAYVMSNEMPSASSLQT